MPISRLRKPIGGTMAIQDSFNLSQATTSQAYAYKCWYNYNYGGNTMKISAKDMGELTQTWNGELANWRATASNDENAYEIEDDDFSTAKNNGKNTVKNDTGYDGGKGGMIAGGVTRGLVSIAGAAATTTATVIGQKVGIGVAKKLVGKAAEKTIAQTASEAGKAAAKIAGEKAAKEAATKAAEHVGSGLSAEAASAAAKHAAEESAKTTAEQGVKNTASKAKVSAIVAAGIAIATAAKYRISKPNKDQKEACDELQNSMQNAQASLYHAQEEMSKNNDEIVDLSDQAQAFNEDANSDIEDKKTDFDMYKASYDALMEKAKSGEPLSEDEKALLKELIPLMQELGIGIGETSDETTEAVGEIYDEMGTKQDRYDDAASTLAEVEGVTDFAESFDEATRTMCYVETASQTLNAASGAMAGAKLLARGPWFWALGGAAIVASASSAVAAREQYDWAGKVGNEINARKDTQDLNATTTGIYDENIDIYAGQMEGVEELELEIPKDLENPDEVVAGLSEESEGILPQNSTPEDNKINTNNGVTTSNNDTAFDNKDKNKKV